MGKKIKVTFLVNAAVLLEYDGVKLLLDGIYDKRGHCFSNLSAKQWEDLKKGSGDFSNIGYLLFTHAHGDHFSAERVAEYLDYQRPKAIFLPWCDTDAFEVLRKKAEKKGIPCVLPDAALCKRTIFRPEPDVAIRVLWTGHLDKLYQDVVHFCYLLTCGTKNILFTADVDFTKESFAELQGIALDAVFVNPLMMQSKEGRRLLFDGILQAKTQIVYHIPFAGEDKMGIRKLAEGAALRTKEGNPIYLMEEGQTCFL